MAGAAAVEVEGAGAVEPPAGALVDTLLGSGTSTAVPDSDWPPQPATAAGRAACQAQAPNGWPADVTSQLHFS